jgi:hypothetical protein
MVIVTTRPVIHLKCIYQQNSMLRYTAAALSYSGQNFDRCTKILRSQDIYFIGYIALGIEVRNYIHITQLSYRMSS